MTGPGQRDEHPSGNHVATKALVLGGAGFIGGHLLSRLTGMPAFTAVQVAGSDASAAAARAGVTALEGSIDADLLAACAHPDVVFWLAGGSSVGASINDPRRDHERSIPPLADLLARLAGPWRGTRLVFVSSAAVYGRSGCSATSTRHALQPISPYGENKKLSEQMIAAAMAADTISAHIVRPFSVYGAGLRRQLFWDAAQKAGRGEFGFFGSGDELRDWVHADDLAVMLADIALHPQRFPHLVNAGTGVAVPIRSALRSLFAAMSISAEPQFAMNVRAGDPDRLVACAEEQQPYAGYFTTSLDDGLRGYAVWLTQQAS